MGSGLTIDYAKLQQEAMRGVVRTVLQRVQASGLPGDHHFYVSFHTLAPGAIVSKRLREKYPQEMTIVLQHRFWDLIVLDDRFEVKLSFDGIPERLVIPFTAIKAFIDPSVRFALPFDDEGTIETAVREPRQAVSIDGTHDQIDEANFDGVRPSPVKKPRPVRKARADKETTVRPASIGATQPPVRSKPEPVTEAAEASPLPETPAAGPKVVSLDLFRKK